MATVDLNLIPVDETQLVLAAGDDTQLVLSAGDETQIVLSSVAISNGLMMTDGSNSALALGSAGTPSLKFAGDANTGVYSPGADQLAVATNGVQRLTVDTAATTSALPVLHPLGAVGTPSITFTGDLNTGFWSPTADTLAASTAGSERFRVTSAGRVGIGTTAPGDILSVTGGNVALQSTGGAGAGDRPTERRLLRSDIGSVNGLAAIGMNGTGTNGFLGEIKFYTGFADLFNTALTERARIDSSGRLLVGTSSSVNTLIQAGLQVQSTGANAYASIGRWDNNAANPGLIFNKSRGGFVGTLGVVQSGDSLGEVSFTGDDGSAFISSARIQAQVDGTPGANDMPGRLVFSTTADGAASPTERMRIKSTGIVNIANTPTYADNAAATAGGLVVGDIYRTSTGQLMIRY